jgi:hypothetical protein
MVMLVATVALRIASANTFRAELVPETVDAQHELVPARHRSECTRDNLTPQMVRLLCSARAAVVLPTGRCSFLGSWNSSEPDTAQFKMRWTVFARVVPYR